MQRHLSGQQRRTAIGDDTRLRVANKLGYFGARLHIDTIRVELKGLHNHTGIVEVTLQGNSLILHLKLEVLHLLYRNGG